MSIQAPPRPEASDNPDTEPAVTVWQRVRYKVAASRHEPTMYIGIILFIVLLYLVVAPIISVISDGVRVLDGTSGEQSLAAN